MENPLKINLSAVTDLNKDDFGAFGENVDEVGAADPAYEDQADEIAAVGLAAKTYGEALTAFNTNRGKDRTKNLANARKAVMVTLKALVKVLELAAPSKADPGAFLTGLGFTLAKIPARRTGVVKAPVKQTVTSGGKDEPKGKVKFVLKAEFPDEIISVVGRRSDDGGLTWVEGIVAPKLAFSLIGQPSGVDCIYQFMFLATNNRKSEWSVNIHITVY